jgi:hypothetical protein
LKVLKNVFSDFDVEFPIVPRRASGAANGKKCADCLSESEFPRAPVAATTRRVKRDTGVFFWFVFFHGKENEQLKEQDEPELETLSCFTKIGKQIDRNESC